MSQNVFEMLYNLQGLMFKIYGLGFGVQSLVFWVNNTLVNGFNKSLNITYKMILKML